MTQCILCIFLSNVDINNEDHFKKATLGQNISLSINSISVLANILLNSFELNIDHTNDAGAIEGATVAAAGTVMGIVSSTTTTSTTISPIDTVR